MNKGFWYTSIYGERYRDVHVVDRQRNLDLELTTGKALSADWTPPLYEIKGKGTWPDWMAFYVPLLSQRALTCLKELIAPHCQLIPWIDEQNHAYSLVNITTVIPRGCWSCEESTTYDGGRTYASADGIGISGIDIPDLFVLEGYGGKIFVSDTVAKASVDNKLKGVAFIDPRIPSLRLPFVSYNFGRRGTGFVYMEDA